MKAMLVFFTRLTALSIWHLLSLVLAALVVGNFVALSDPGQPSVGIAPLLTIGVLETTVIMWLISRSNLVGIQLLMFTLIVFHGTKIFLMMIELAFFLNIWASPPMISLERVFALELHGLLMAGLFCSVAVIISGKWKLPIQYSSPVLSRLWPKINSKLCMRILGVSILYAACYWFAGSYILIPLAGDSFMFTYTHLKVPLWMPLFQVGRGLVWALIIVLLVRHLRLQGARLHLGVGLVLAVLGGAQLLAPNPYMLDHLRYAHMVEIAVSMLVFGGIASWTLRSEQGSVANKLV